MGSLLDDEAGTASSRGWTSEQFESVRAALERRAQEHGEVGVAASAYLDGEQVLDLWWGDADGAPWQQDTLVRVASSTKGALTLCAQILYDRGLLDVDAPVTDYWPEYGAAGKQDTLVSHLLDHTAGVLTFPNYWEVVGEDMAGLTDWDLITSRLAASPPSWQPGSQTMYHAHTIGFLVGELIRRIDGRTVGRFFAEEVAAPLGLELYIGTPDAALPRVARTLPERPVDLDALPEADRLLYAQAEEQSARARELVRGGDVLNVEALSLSAGFVHPDTEPGDLEAVYERWNEPLLLQAELPQGNGVTTARHLARMYALLARGGELDGVRLVSPETVERFRRFSPDSASQPVFGLGYHNLSGIWAVDGASAQAFGHSGAGGQLAFADPQRGVSFALVKNQSFSNWVTARDVAAAVYRCL